MKTGKLVRIPGWAALFCVAVTMDLMAAAPELPRDRLDHILQKPTEYRRLKTSQADGAIFRAYRDDDLSSASFGTELCVLEIPHGSAQFRVKDLRRFGSAHDVYPKSVPVDAVAAVTGGFFGLDANDDPTPLGLVKVEGKVTNRRHPWTSGGVLAITSSVGRILRIHDFEDSGEIIYAVQSKPLLVEGGRDGIRTNAAERFDRSAVALSTAQEILLVVLHEPRGQAGSLAEFSHLILRLRTERGNAIDWALAMDGGPGAHLYVRDIERHCGSRSPNYLPNLVYVVQ